MIEETSSVAFQVSVSLRDVKKNNAEFTIFEINKVIARRPSLYMDRIVVGMTEYNRNP